MLLVMAQAAAGCAAGKGGTGLQRVEQAYHAGDYATAYREASQIATRKTSAQWQVAAYYAGRSARELRDAQQAEAFLKLAASGSDGEIIGRSQADLGLLYAEQNKYEPSAASLQKAATLLRGEDQAQALLHAGIALQKAGRWQDARASLLRAQHVSRDAALQARAGDLADIVAYTLQFGAFGDAGAANRLAASISAQTRPLKLGEARVYRIPTASGSVLHVVQAGRFSNYDAASRMRLRWPEGQCVVMTVKK